MGILKATTLILLAAVLSISTPTSTYAQSSDDIRQRMIAESIRNYSGNCPCPYNVDRAGRRCGGRSAHSRPGGASPLCFPSDISDARLQDYRRRNGL